MFFSSTVIFLLSRTLEGPEKMFSATAKGGNNMRSLKITNFNFKRKLTKKTMCEPV